MDNRYSQLAAVGSAIVTRILPMFISGFVYAQPEPGYTARDLNPDAMKSGRTAGVVIDPHDLRLAYTISQGGVFGSTDGGMTWYGNFNPDGTPGPYGNGLGNGLTNFNTVAVDPFNSNNILAMVDDDNRADPATRTDGIWRSSDRGRTFHVVAPHPCPDPIRFLTGHIRFSNDRLGLVVASSVCGLGISFDAGATWRFFEPGPSGSHLIDGLDLFPAGGNFFGFPSTSDIAGFCYASKDGSNLSAGFYDIATGTFGAFLVPAVIRTDNLGCSLAFDPRTPVHFFIAGTGSDGTREKGVFEGLISGFEAFWNDLNAPSIGAGHPGAGAPNGRPPVIQVRRNGNSIRIYYHDTTTFRYEDCSSLPPFSCPVGPPFDPAHPEYELCPPDGRDNPAGPWHCLNTQFSDSTEIAFGFNLLNPTTPCPALLSGDGGNERSTDCGASWSFVSGIHTLLVDDAAFTGIGDSRRIILANFDTGFAIHDRTGAWSFVGSDGWVADAIRTESDEFVVSGGPEAAAVIDLPYHGVNRFIVPPLPKPWLGTGLGGHFAPRYYADHQLVIATLSSSPEELPMDQLQLWTLDTTVFPKWRSMGAPIGPQAGSFTAGNAGDLAVGGRLNTDMANKIFYVITPSSAGRALYCLGDRDRVDYATGLTNPLRVWASEADPSWAYVYNYDSDPAKRGVYVTSSGKRRCAFVRDDLASDLLTRGTEFKGVDDQEETNPVNGFSAPMTAVGFDPKRRQRAAIGTTHNGILVTQDQGASWSVSHAFPEPNSRPVSIYFDDSGYPSTIEETLVAASGRGVWAVHFGAGAAHYIGVVGVRPAGDLTARIQLLDEAGVPVAHAAAYFTVRSLSPVSQVRPIEIQGAANANGIVDLNQKVALPPGQYVITARFDRGPRFAAVWAAKTFAIKKNEDDE